MKYRHIIRIIFLCILLSATFIYVDESYTTVYAATEYQQKAIDFAKEYLKEHPRCCKQELVDVLNQEFLLSSTSEYAADHCGANWNKRAVKAAKSYLKQFSFSKKSLMLQLEFEGFTEKEAKYGVRKCGLLGMHRPLGQRKNYVNIGLLVVICRRSW